MDWIAWIVMGLLAGIVAKMLVPGGDPGGIIVTIIIGIVGAFLGGFIGKQMGWGGVDGFTWHTFALSLGGACILLLVLRVVSQRK